MSCNSPEVIFLVISTSSFNNISPVSNPTSISIVVFPVFSSPLIITQFKGAAPLYIGNNDACKFIHPYLGISSTSLVNI